MKKIVGIIFILSIALTTLTFIFGFEEEKQLHFNLKLNEDYLKLVERKSPELSKGNANKFGGDITKSSLDVQFFDIVEIEKKENNISYESQIKGVIKTSSGNFNFKGDGDLNELTLSDGSQLFVGNYEAIIKNKQGENILTLSLRYDPNTEEIDIVVVSGVVGDTGILPFGQPFLLDDKLNEITELLEL